MLSNLKYFYRQHRRAIDRAALYLSLVCSIFALIYLGYSTNIILIGEMGQPLIWAFYFLFSLHFIRTLFSFWTGSGMKVEHYAGLFIFLFFLLIISARFFDLDHSGTLSQPEWIYLGIFSLTLVEVSRSSLFLDQFFFNPTILFVISFIALILIGAFLLMLPNSVRSGLPLSFVDALFMATSAVCITGLTVVEVARTFTPFGQTILLVLIQLGGLGIMTFTGFFGYFFSGGFSYKNQLMYGEILGQNKVGAVVNTLLKIIFVTLLVEAVGAVFIFFSVPKTQFDSYGAHVFFSVFHAVSAFCNAGFSIAENGLGNAAYRFNYNLQLILVSLFILGGLGFIIVFNSYTYIRRWMINFYQRLLYGKAFIHKAWVISFNARLMAWSSLLLIVGSTLLFFIFEYNNSLAEHEGFVHKLIAALFMGNSSRTSGFAMMDTNQLSFPMLLIIMLLMWIGASPGSTGGGIKNTTFSIALLNILSLAKGRDQLEIFHRRISNDSVHKAFAIIMLSFIAIGVSISLLAFTDGEMGLRAIAFEAFSAYATCGLSLGITPQLSDAGKIIIAATMFTGRVGLLTLLVALIKDIKNKSYSYPEEKVLF